MREQEVRNLWEAYLEVCENQQLDEISQKTAITAYARRSSNEFEGDDGPDRVRKNNELHGRIVKKFGDKSGEDANKAADANTFGRTDSRTGKRQERPKSRIEKNRTYRTTKAGKMHGQDQAKLKSDLEKRRNVNDSYEYDTFDTILEHLVAEGYADTNEAALAIMANMSEEWRESIVEGKSDRPLGYMHPFARGMKQPKGEKSEEKHGQDTEGNITGKYKVKGV